MVQKIFGVGMGATGIVGTLVIAGILLKATNLSVEWGELAIFGGVGIGLVLGLLGTLAVIKKVVR